jgi:ribosomal protein L11 methyltransferase
MPFLQLTLDIGAIDPTPFEDTLLAAGALSITLQDAADDPVLEPAPGTTPLWPNVRLSALFDAAVDPEEICAALRSELPHVAVTPAFETIADRAWEREWLKDFKPMRFGRRLWVCPGEQTIGAADEDPGVERCIVRLDPGLAFGTGTHPTTALCMEWLDAASVRGKTVIDYGCGSGILAVAALKLGAAHVLAVDIDLQALAATLDNARRNDVADRLTVQPAAAMTGGPVDMLLANILAEPLEQLAPRLAALVLADGSLVLSGLLREQAQRVAMKYEPWFDMSGAVIRNDWARLDGIRKRAAPRIPAC